MNNFKASDIGGLPLKLNDFQFITNGLLEAFRGVMSSYGITDSLTIILNGCEKTSASGITTIAEGYISIGGEICYVPEHSYPDPTVGEFEYWDIDITFDPEGLKTFQSTDTFDTYEIRVGKVITDTVIPSGYTAYDDAQNLFEIIKEKLPIDEFVTFDSYTDTEYGTGDYELQCMKDISNFVHIRGKMMVSDPGGGMVNVIVANLPVGYRPELETDMLVGYIYNDTTGELRYSIFRIKTNGDIVLVTYNGGAAFVFDLGQITPFKSA